MGTTYMPGAKDSTMVAIHVTDEDDPAAIMVKDGCKERWGLWRLTVELGATD